MEGCHVIIQPESLIVIQGYPLNGGLSCYNTESLIVDHRGYPLNGGLSCYTESLIVDHRGYPLNGGLSCYNTQSLIVIGVSSQWRVVML